MRTRIAVEIQMDKYLYRTDRVVDVQFVWWPRSWRWYIPLWYKES